MKKLTGFFLRTSKEIKRTNTGGYLFYACADSQTKGASTPMWITLIAEGSIAQQILAAGETIPPVVNVSGDIAEMGVKNGIASVTVLLETFEAAEGFSAGHMYMSLADVVCGKDLWNNNEKTFSRTSGAIKFGEDTEWADLKFLGTSINKFVESIKLKKGAHLNIIGEVTDLGVNIVNGIPRFNLSLNVPMVSRVNSKPYEPQQAPQAQVQMPTPQVQQQTYPQQSIPSTPQAQQQTYPQQSIPSTPQAQTPIPQVQQMPAVYPQVQTQEPQPQQIPVAQQQSAPYVAGLPIENVGNTQSNESYQAEDATAFLHKMGFI